MVAGGIADSSPVSKRRRIANRVLQLAVAIVVLVFISRAVAQARLQLSEQPAAWQPPHLGWLAVAGVTYLAGLLPMAVYWQTLLKAMGLAASWPQALRAYYVGHLGKYVPGKAMVVVLRVGLLHAAGPQRAGLAVSVITETLTMMSVGAGLAARVVARWRTSAKITPQCNQSLPVCSFRNKKKNSQATLYGATGRNASGQGGHFYCAATSVAIPRYGASTVFQAAVRSSVPARGRVAPTISILVSPGAFRVVSFQGRRPNMESPKVALSGEPGGAKKDCNPDRSN